MVTKLRAMLKRIASNRPEFVYPTAHRVWRFVLALCFFAMGAIGSRAQESSVVDMRSLSYDGALKLLQTRNRDLLLAQRNIEAARADNIAALARPNPNIALSTAAINPRRFGGSTNQNNQVDAIVQLSQLFERGNKRQLRGDVTQLAIAATQGDYAEVLRQITIDLAEAYYGLLFAQERVRIADDTVGLFGRTVAAAELRLKAGDIAPSDLSRIKVDQLRAENDRRAAVADLEAARQRLAFLIGQESESNKLTAADVWPTAANEVRPADMRAVVEARADVRAAQLRVEAADKVRTLARALRTRDVTVAAQYERYPGQVQNNTFGVGVSIPLFINYNFDGEIRRAEVGMQAANDSLERARAAALTEINQAWARLASARERVQRYDGGLLKEAQRAADAAEFAYRNGALGVIDLLDARRILFLTRVDAAGARADLAKATIAWRNAINPYTAKATP